MNEQELFQELKKRILETYQNFYPQFQGDWKNFSSKDIRQLIDLIEIQLKERVSEKWIYTHLKPESNDKLPRKDMLDIFAKFTGFSDWDEFLFQHQEKSEKYPTPKLSKNWYWLLMIPILGAGIYFLPKKKAESKTIEIKNEFTKEPVPAEEIQVFSISNEENIPVDKINSTIEVQNDVEKVIIESPYFEKKEVEISKTDKEIWIRPEDYALVLKTFIESDLKDWEERKVKLEKILSEDLEVIILLKENLGAEYLNKKEFAEKLIIPTSETNKMKILSLETNDNKEITFIRIQQL